MFDNYGQYAKDIIDAARHMTPKGGIKMSKMIAGTSAALIACGGALAMGNTAFAHAEMQAAIESVVPALDDQTIEVRVDDPSDTSMAAMLSDAPNNLTAKDEAAIAGQIKSAITPETLANAAGSFNADGVLELEMTTSDNIPVIVQVKKDDTGNYAIEKIVAVLDAQQAKDKKQEVSSVITNDDQKTANAHPLGSFADNFAAVTGLDENASDEDRQSVYDNHMLVLADNLIMGVPAGYSLQDDGTPMPEDPIPMTDGNTQDVPEAKASADRIEPYAYSYKNDTGSIFSIRSENLGIAFKSMNGLDGVNKMKDYWAETATSVSTGANQTLKTEDGFSTEVFYDSESGMWGYFGHVEFTDGTRDVIYNRVVFVDELADQLITVSYRHDCQVDVGSAMSFDDFKKMIMHAPNETTDGSAYKTYADKLYQVQILPGQTLTEPKRIALEEEQRKAAEEVANGASEVPDSAGSGQAEGDMPVE